MKKSGLKSSIKPTLWHSPEHLSRQMFSFESRKDSLRLLWDKSFLILGQFSHNSDHVWVIEAIGDELFRFFKLF